MTAPWRDTKEMLADLRALGVREAAFAPDGVLLHVQFYPSVIAPPAPAEERQPAPKRSLDDRLLRPLGIGEEKRA